MPESFAALIPAKPGPVYKFGGEAGSEEAVGAQLAAKLTNAIRQKATQVRIAFFHQPIDKSNKFLLT